MNGSLVPGSYRLVLPLGKGIPLSELNITKVSSNTPAACSSCRTSPTPRTRTPNTNDISKQVIVNKRIIPTPNHRALQDVLAAFTKTVTLVDVVCSTVESFEQPQCKIKLSYNTKSLDIIPWSSRLIVLYWAAISSLAAGVSGTKYGTSTYRMRTETFKLNCHEVFIYLRTWVLDSIIEMNVPFELSTLRTCTDNNQCDAMRYYNIYTCNYSMSHLAFQNHWFYFLV